MEGDHILILIYDLFYPELWSLVNVVFFNNLYCILYTSFGIPLIVCFCSRELMGISFSCIPDKDIRDFYLG